MLIIVLAKLNLASANRLPIIDIRVTLTHLHCPLHCCLYGVVHNFLVSDNSHSSPMSLILKLHPKSLRIFSGRP